jgi:hypothetical protein
VRTGDDPWVAITDWAAHAHEVLVGFPGTAGHLLTVWFDLPSVLIMTDDLLGLVIGAGLKDLEAVAAVNAVFVYVLMRAQAQNVVRGARVTKRTLALASTGRPLTHLRPLASYYSSADFETHFAYGLRALVTGIQATRISC